jgi:methionyl-tRNA formyltransferase
MKILFIGTVRFSYEMLKKLIELNADIVGVCTKSKSSFNSDFLSLEPLCKEKNIPCRLVENINAKENVAWIKSVTPDIIFCFGWSSLIKKELLELTPMGVVGFHPAALPHNRGRHPIIWSLVLGLKESASTFFFMKEGVDDGDILSQKYFTILESDDAESLYKKILQTAKNQVELFLPKLQNKTYSTAKQNSADANIWRKRTKEDGKIDFRMSSKNIYNLVRALTAPYAGAHIAYKENDIKVWKVAVASYNKANIEPGKVLEHNNKALLVKTSDGAIQILQHEFEVLPKVGEYI